MNSFDSLREDNKGAGCFLIRDITVALKLAENKF